MEDLNPKMIEDLNLNAGVWSWIEGFFYYFLFIYKPQDKIKMIFFSGKVHFDKKKNPFMHCPPYFTRKCPSTN